MNNEKISILMGIYNCEKTLHKAIDSILNQTYTNIELVMCDDGSKDNTYQVAKTYYEKYPDRIVLIKNEVNKGLNITLNNCFRASTGKLLARQDADDVSLSNRLEVQAKYLDEHPDCAFVSTGMYVNNGTKRIGKRVSSDIHPKAIGFMKSNQFFHAPVMIRREALQAVNGYTEDKKLLRVEDYNLWTKLYAKGFHGDNIQECYYEVYEDEAVYSRRKMKYRINGAYALILAVDMLKLPQYYKLYALKGILKGFVPEFIYKLIHKNSAIN